MCSMNNHKFQLLQGDAFNLLPTLPEKSFDLIFVDPPYFLGKDKWDISQGVEKDFDFHLNWIIECRRLLKDNGTIWISGTHHNIYQCGFALQNTGFYIINDIAWYKPRSPKMRTTRMLTPTHETLIWAAKNKNSRYTYNFEYMKHVVLKDDYLHNSREELKSVWAINAPGRLEKMHGEHPTQKPTQLLKRVILSCTKPGDKILDPFCGSGTTGIVSYLYGRDFTGIEKDNTYIAIANKRLEYLKNNLAFKLNPKPNNN